MKIAVDCRMLLASGVGSTLRGILPYFIESGNSLFIISNDEVSNALRHIPDAARGIERGGISVSIWNKKTFSFDELFFPPAALIKKINACDAYFTPFFNIPARIKIPVYTMIHDIIFPDMPELTGRAGLAARMFFYRRAFRLSAAVFTVSEFSASRIKHYAQKTNPALPVYVVYNAAKTEIAAGRPPCIKTNTILFAGNIKKHKGLAVLIAAFETARKRGLAHRLVIVGSKENFRTKEAALGFGAASATATALKFGAASAAATALGFEAAGAEAAAKDAPLVFTGFLPDDELCGLYARAALLVQPSLYEGFGLPPLEAMFLGTAALISDIPVFKEIYSGFPVRYFRAGDAADLADKLCELLLDKEPRAINLPPSLRERYSFAKTANRILDVITDPRPPAGR